MEQESAEIFTEGVALVEDSSDGKVPVEIWDHFLIWCVERLEDERSPEVLKKKVIS